MIMTSGHQLLLHTLNMFNDLIKFCNVISSSNMIKEYNLKILVTKHIDYTNSSEIQTLAMNCQLIFKKKIKEKAIIDKQITCLIKLQVR